MRAVGVGIPVFESGCVVLLTGDVQVLQVNLTSKRIDVDVEDKAFIKRVIAMRSELTPPKPDGTEDESVPNVGGALSMVRSVAETLRSHGITITFSYRGRRIATVGAEAHPTLLQHITKTRGVAINSVLAAIRMVI